MHKSLVKPALGLTLASLLSPASASPLQRKQQLQCVQDDIYIGLWENDTPDYYVDVQRFCASELGETVTTDCVGTNTDTSTIYADATATETVTSPTYVPASTVTVVTTAVNFELRKRGPQPAPVTAAYGMIKRQASATPSYNTASALLSACACGNPDPGTTQALCTSTSTRTVNGFFKTTLYTPVTVASTTTITETVNVTQSINTSIPVPTATPTSSWALNWSDWSSTSSYSTTQEIEPTYISTTTTSAMPSVTPSGCPAEDGSIFSSNNATCYDYEYVCGRTYADSDFSDEFRYPTPEACTAVCDAQNAGSGPVACLGIVWNTTAAVYNCRTLKSLDSPLDDAASVALLLVPNASCGNTTSSTTSTTKTRSRPAGTGTWTGPWGVNNTGIWPHTGTGTWTSRPTGTWGYNHTVNSTSYTSSMNTTISSYTPSSGTGTGMPTMTSNSTCPASTVTSNYTITAVIISSVTQYANATTTSTDFVTNTIFETATSIKTKKSASTVTITQTATDTKTNTETDFVAATATVIANASTITITQTATSTETDTETDTVTTTETDFLAATATETDTITSIPDAVTITITPTASTITILESSIITVSVTVPGLTITETDMGATITLAASTATETETTTVEETAAPTTDSRVGKMGRKWVAWN